MRVQAHTLCVNGRPTSYRVGHARRWHQRAVGLLLTPHLNDPVGLWIDACNAIHMLGMRYPIDAVFVDAQGHILRVWPHVRPWGAAWCWPAKACLELRAGLSAELGLGAGQQLGRSPI
jgi:uncharacterized protein